MFLTASHALLSMLCYLHTGLLIADPTQRPSTEKNSPRSLVADGKKLRDGGHLAEAISTFARAKQLAILEHDSIYSAKIEILLGTAYSLHNQYGAALESFEDAIKAGRQLKDPLIIGAASGNVAGLYWQLGDFDAAEAKSQLAIQCLIHVKPDKFSTDCLSGAYMIHAAVCVQQKKSVQGYHDFDASLALAERNNDTPRQTMILLEKGVALMGERHFPAAESVFRQAETLSKLDPSTDELAITKANLAQVELEKTKSDPRIALQLINEAFALRSPKFRASPQYYPLDIKGRVLLAMHNKTLALSEFRKAVDAADLWRTSALPGDTTNAQTAQELQTVYEDYAHLAADLALATHNDALSYSALEILAENRAASLREQFRVVYGSNGKLPDEYFAKLAELQNAQANVTLGNNSSKQQAALQQIRLDISDLENKIGLKSDKITELIERNPRRNSLRDIQSTLAREQVLLSITLGKSRSYLWSITANRVNLLQLAGEEELTSLARSFTDAVRNQRDVARSADAFSQSLFAGLPADVWNRSEWMLVADGPLLDAIPFCALPSQQRGQPRKLLIEEKSIRFLPSELLLLDHREQPASKAFVGIGDPIYNQADPRMAQSRADDGKTFSDGVTLARLAGSEKEIRAAARALDPSQAILLTGADANRHSLAAALSHPPEIIHFAVHVVSPPDEPQHAALALSLKNNIPELLTPEGIAAFHVPGSLVVLSGCSSGQGKVIPGAGLMGLSRAWLLAGAAAVIVSDWPTPDDSGRFFSSFYDHFDHTGSGGIAQRAALALSRTQTDMLRSHGYRAFPSFWGAFAVIAKE